MGSVRRWAPKVVALAIYIIVILVATPQAQQPVAFSGAPGAITAGPAATVTDATNIDLLVGRSTILNVGSVISRVSLTVPDVADAMVTTPQQLLIHGKAPGTISLFVWDHAGGIKTYVVNVRRDLTQLVEQMKQLFPGEDITVTGSGKDVIISGTVSSKYVVDKAADVAEGYVDKKENVVDLLKQQEGVASNQVMLRVRFAEVSRSAMQELGASLLLDQFKNDWFGRSTTQQFAAPNFDSSKPDQLDFSDFLNLFVFNSKHGVGAVVRALQSKGLFQSLAEPDLIALNGKEASFLAGGEYPYPVVQAGSNSSSITIQFKEFGVRLSFTPTVLANNLIDLKVTPEVSTLDFTNAVILQGFRVPALSTRRTSTEVELQDGQTFAIAGLLNNTLNNTMQKIPGIGDIPILGNLFRSRAYQKDQTELVVMITPTVLRQNSTGVSEGLPSLVEPYLAKPDKAYPNPAPYTGSPRYAPDHSPKAGGAAPQPTQDEQTSSTAPSQMPAAATMPSDTTRRTEQPMRNPQAAPSAAVPPVMPTPAAEPAADPNAAKHAAEAKREADKQAADQAAAARRAADEKAKADKETAKQKTEADKKAAEDKAAADKKAAEEKKIADKKAAGEKERQAKLDAERSKREAEVAKKVAEADRKKQEDQDKRAKALADAAAKLKAAQNAYQAQVSRIDKNGGGGQTN
jgi:pilus assembly protein CpaC